MKISMLFTLEIMNLTIRALLAPRDALFFYTIFAQGQKRALLAPHDALFFYTIFAQGQKITLLAPRP